MKTKTSPRRAVKKPAKKTPATSAKKRQVAVVSIPLTLKPSDPIVFTETTADHVRFFNPGEDAPFSVIHNGPEGSENAWQVSQAMEKLQAQGYTVKAR